MWYNKNILRDNLKYYLEGKLTAQEFAKWVREIYCDLLMGAPLWLDKLAMYPMIRVLSSVDVIEDCKADILPCTLEEMQRIYMVLQGEIQEIFNVRIKIPWNIKFKEVALYEEKRDQYFIIKEIFLKHKENVYLNDEEKDECLKIFSCKNEEKGTILYLLDSYIKACIRHILDAKEIDYLNDSLGLYTKANSKENRIVEKLLSRIDEYTGTKDLDISILYDAGEYQIFL